MNGIQHLLPDQLATLGRIKTWLFRQWEGAVDFREQRIQLESVSSHHFFLQIPDSSAGKVWPDCRRKATPYLAIGKPGSVLWFLTELS